MSDTALVILAHAGASATILEFEPYWRRLRLPLIAALPAGDDWPGDPPDQVWSFGESARLGPACVRRFAQVCRACAAAGFDRYVLMEYDTLNLDEHLPEFRHGCISCAGAVDKSVEPVRPCLSPWMASRPLLHQLAAALDYTLSHPLPPPLDRWVEGYLDRWIGAAIWQAGLPLHILHDTLPWPWPHFQPAAEIACGRARWVHGYKRLSEVPTWETLSA